MQGTRSRSPESRLEGVQEELAGTTQELHQLEQELHKDSTNCFLLKKYERLTRREQLLLDERKLWAGQSRFRRHPCGSVPCLHRRPRSEAQCTGLHCQRLPGRAAATAGQLSAVVAAQLPSLISGSGSYIAGRIILQLL